MTLERLGRAMTFAVAPVALALSGAPLFAAPPAAPPVVAADMSLDELRACAKHVLHIRANEAIMQRTDSDIAAFREAIRKDTADMEARRPRLNLRDPKQVAAFNARIRANHAAADRFAAMVTRRNAQLPILSADYATHRKMCADRPYAMASLDQLTPAEREAMKAISRDIDPLAALADGADNASNASAPVATAPKP